MHEPARVLPDHRHAFYRISSFHRHSSLAELLGTYNELTACPKEDLRNNKFTLRKKASSSTLHCGNHGEH
jgi:hypothetical protein